MSMSGVEVPQEIIDTYVDLQKGKKYQYIVLQMEKIGVKTFRWSIKELGERIAITDNNKDSDKRDYRTLESVKKYFDEFVETQLQDDLPCVAIYDCNCSKGQLGLIQWCPDSSPIGLKMPFAASVDSMKKSLNATQKYIQASDKDDVSFEFFLKP